MPPTVRPGDLLLVDKSEAAMSEIREGAMYILRIGGSAVLRRLQRSDGGWLLVSDTPEIVPINVPKSSCSVTILGRVAAQLRRFI